jgi:hypothetical protein
MKPVRPLAENIKDEVDLAGGVQYDLLKKKRAPTGGWRSDKTFNS